MKQFLPKGQLWKCEIRNEKRRKSIKVIQVWKLRKEQRLVNSILDSSDSAPPPPAPSAPVIQQTEKSDSESVFLKSLSALRDNNLSPANENSVLTAGRLVGAMGINSSDGSDDEGKLQFKPFWSFKTEILF